MKELTADWFKSASTQTLAKQLLGMTLQVAECRGLIVETEAYLGVTDKAAHVYGGRRTKTNGALWAAPGTVYVYGLRQYRLLNLITQPEGTPEGILIRAVEPVAGVELMAARRHQSGPGLTNGPGKLCQALAIDLDDNFTMVNAGRIQVFETGRAPEQIITTPRIGVPNKDEATTALLRYYVAGNPSVSGIKKVNVDKEERGWQPWQK